MSLLSVTIGRQKPRKKSIVGLDLGIIALDIGVYGTTEQEGAHNTDTHVNSACVDQLNKELASWKCRSHNSSYYDIFLSYRVCTDAELAEKLVDHIHLQHKQLQVFLDKICLPVGENWESGFLNGLMNSRVVALLISRQGIESFKHAHTRHDNMLLEYETALNRLADEGPNKIKIIPIFVGRKITTMIDGEQAEVIQKFQFPNLLDFADEPHKSTGEPNAHKSTLTVREVVKQIFSLQGIFLNDLSNLTGLVTELVRILQTP